MIALICVLAVLGLGNTLEQLPTRREIESSINRTIDEVERMIVENPSLPRLSRSQIVDILYNITSKDMDSYEDSVEKTREQYQRALMVVLPNNFKDAKNATTQIVQGQTKSAIKTSANFSATPKTMTESPKTVSTKTSNDLISVKTKNDDEHRVEDLNVRWKNHRQQYGEVLAKLPTEESINKLLNSDRDRQSAPERFSFDLARFGSDKTTDKAGGTKLTNRERFRPTTMSKTNLEIVYSTSVTEKPTTKVVSTTKMGVERFRPTMPSTVSSQNVLTFDQWRYNAPPVTTTLEPRKPTTVASRNEQKITKERFLPTMMTQSDRGPVETLTTLGPQTTTPKSGRTKGSPWDMENLRTMNVNDKPMSVFVTPMSSTTSSKLGRLVNDDKDVDATKAPVAMRDEVKDLLASIGLRPKPDGSNESTKDNISVNQDQIFGTNFKIPESNNVPIGQALGLASLGIESPSINSQNTFELTPQDVKQGFSNLSPDVQLLFQRFGLQNSVKDFENSEYQTTTEKIITTTPKTNFWNNFKPLPASDVKDEGMKDFLAKFGLGVTSKRNEKTMKTMKRLEKNNSPSMLEAVPASMKGILENIGLITRAQNPVSKFVGNLETTEIPELHVFKPHETSIDDVIQRRKINELLDMVRMVQEGKADVVDVQEAAKQLLESTRGLKNGPDPLSLEEILKIYKDDVKNEIKRQQNPKELAEMATSENSDATSTTTTTTTTTTASTVSPDNPANSSDSSVASSDTAAASADSDVSSDGAKNSGIEIEAATTENSNLAALADSFGGTTSAPDPVLPTRRKNGLYFLVDWNTFLEVGEEGSERVNLRFQPKVGDRTRFLPVTVP